MASFSAIRLVSGKDVLQKSSQIFKPESRKITIPYSPFNFKFDINLDSRSFNTRNLEAAIERGTEKLADGLRSALDEAMTSSAWGWNGGSRDIVDTGELMNSLSVTLRDGGIDIAYDSDYASIVHYGGYIYPYGNTDLDKVYLPGRPWIRSVLTGDGPIPQIDWKSYYRGVLK